jgi:hypothetical protein
MKLVAKTSPGTTTWVKICSLMMTTRHLALMLAPSTWGLVWTWMERIQTRTSLRLLQLRRILIPRSIKQVSRNLLRLAWHVSHFITEQQGPSDADIHIIQALLHKIRSKLTAAAFEGGQWAFSGGQPSIPPLPECHRQLADLAGFDAIKFNCCFNSCICYATDAYRDLDTCLYCKEPRYDKRGKPRKQFSAIPLIPILLAFVESQLLGAEMGYRARYKEERQKHRKKDVFDGRHYRHLWHTRVVINDHTLPHQFFSDPRDIALGLATDGFAPYKKTPIMAWPLILVNYNLPPTLCFCRENIICVGCIPGPNKPKDMDSFLWFFISELLRLAAGVKAFDGKNQFILHAYLILCTGDMPAVAMIMRMLGHNAISSCWMCTILGVRNPANPRATTHYPALDRRRHPTKPNPTAYDAKNLPMQAHNTFLAQAHEIQLTAGVGERNHLSTAYGIKGVPALSFLPSVSFPTSFPFGLMHLFFENIIPDLVDMWSHKFNPSLPKDDDFIIALRTWKAIGEAGAMSGTTIPSLFGSRVPNIITERHMFTAETWMFWTIFLAPTLLRGRFPKDKYYKHFMALQGLIKDCLAFELWSTKINEMEEGFISWVMAYERYVHCFIYSIILC